MSVLSGRSVATVLAGVYACTAIAATVLPAQQRVVASEQRTTPSRAWDTLLRAPVTVRLDHVSLRRALDLVAERAKVQVQYQAEIVDAVTRPITLDVTNVPLGVVFDKILEGTALRIVPVEGTLLSLVPSSRHSTAVQAGGIAGTVTNAKTKLPIVGATILLDNASRGVLTGEDGAFRLPATAGTHTVHVRALGFVKQARQVTVTEGATASLAVALDASTSVLDEVVVTGTVVATERKAIPNPITVITAKDIEQRGITRIDQIFRGEVPGVLAMERGAGAFRADAGTMATTELYSRGSSNLSGTANPLKVYVDGVELLDPSYLGTIDPQSIERIEIITGPQAATVYGSGAMGGVMQIFTKKGLGSLTPDVTVSAKYGMLQSNMSNALAPSHVDALNITGGTGPAFSYAGSLSYGYTGQWQPLLYNRTYGGSAGVTHVNGPFTVSGSVSTTGGSNGTYGTYNPYYSNRFTDGTYMDAFRLLWVSPQKVSSSTSQVVSGTLDYRPFPLWQHHLTLGRSAMNFDVMPSAPVYATPSDSSFAFSSSTGLRNSISYNTTVMAPLTGLLSSTLTLGLTTSQGKRVQYSGTAPKSTATSLSGAGVYPSSDRSSGGFLSWQLGVASKLFLTFGLRGERNPQYGRDRKIDWTPTNGATYTIEVGELTVKALASYGRATRPPSQYQRDEVITTNVSYDPSRYVSRFAAPQLGPEYARGPQGGLELYYGNRGSLTINRYRQTVTDLLLSVTIDSLQVKNLSTGDLLYLKQSQYQNVARIGQQGWEGTGSLNFGPLSFKGTYSWNDSRVEALAPTIPSYCTGAGCVAPGYLFLGVPTHTANGIVSYARGGTSVTMTVNWVGASVDGQDATEMYWGAVYYARHKMYLDRKTTGWGQIARPSYTKSDLAVAQRVSPWASLTLNMTNLANRFTADASYDTPSLGRQTLVGVSLRFPKR